MYHDVLLPTDGSPDAALAVPHAVEVARAHDARLHVLHVTDTDALPLDAHAQEQLALRENEGRAALDEIEERAAEADVDVECTIVEGSPARTIVEYATERGVDLIVMGTHGRRGLRRYLLGSVTDRVVRQSPAPVMTVPPAERGRDE